jgi:hypothetical protein
MTMTSHLSRINSLTLQCGKDASSIVSVGFGSEITAELVRLTAQKNCDQEAEAQRDPQC